MCTGEFYSGGTGVYRRNVYWGVFLRGTGVCRRNVYGGVYLGEIFERIFFCDGV